MDSPAAAGKGAGRLYRAALGFSLLAAAVLVGAGAFLALERSRGAGRLEVDSVPPDCEVRLDGKFAGTTPLTVPGVAPGEHFVEIGCAGYVPRVLRVQLAAGESRPVRAELRPQDYGSLEIESRPSGATVELDGESRGNTPLEIGKLSPGTHRLILRRARHDPWSRNVRVQAGRTAKVSVKLQDSFLRFLSDAIAARPGDMAPRADLIHYLRTQGMYGLMEEHAAAGIMTVVRGKAKERGKYLWLMVYRESARMPSADRRAFLPSLARRLVKECGDETALKRKLVAEMIKSSEYSAHRFNKSIARQLVYLTAAGAAGERAAVERALDLAAGRGESEQVKTLMLAAARARPGDGSHTGVLAVRVLNHIKAGRLSSARGSVLATAVQVVEKALKTKQKDRALEARLRRLFSRLRLAQGRKKDSLADLETAIGILKTVGKAEAGRLAAWRLERAELLLDLGRAAEGKALLEKLAAGDPDAEVRKRAAERLKELAPPPK